MNKLIFKLAALLGLIVVFILCLLLKAEYIENDILTRSTAALNNIPLQNAEILVDGRDVYLNGIVESKQLKSKSGKTVANVWGVRIVQNNLTIKKTIIDTAHLDTDETKEIKSVEQTLKDVTLSNIEFESGSSVLKPGSYQFLNDLADTLKKYTEVKISIIGHTDSVGDDDSNLTLSIKRAKSVKSYLINKEIKAERLNTEGFGSSRPIADNSTAEGRKKNRRVEFKLIGVK